MSVLPAELQHILICNNNINALEAAKTRPHILVCLIFCDVSKMSEVMRMGRVGTVMHGFTLVIILCHSSVSSQQK